MKLDRRRLITIVIGFVLVSILVGGSWIINGNQGGDQRNESEGATVLGFEQISFNGSIEADGEFRLDGEVEHNSISWTPGLSYDNVSMQLYAANGTFLYGECLGDLPNHGEIPVNVTRDRIPAYVIVYTQDIWTLRERVGTNVVYMEREHNYLYAMATDRRQYPVNVSGHDPCE